MTDGGRRGETTNIAALPAIARLGADPPHNTRGPLRRSLTHTSTENRAGMQSYRVEGSKLAATSITLLPLGTGGTDGLHKNAGRARCRSSRSRRQGAFHWPKTHCRTLRAAPRLDGGSVPVG